MYFNFWVLNPKILIKMYTVELYTMIISANIYKLINRQIWSNKNSPGKDAQDRLNYCELSIAK